MTDASELSAPDDAGGEELEHTVTVRPVGGLLVAAALVFVGAVIASVAATAIFWFSEFESARLIDRLYFVAGNGVTLLHAGLLVGAALLLVAAEFHDVDSPWFPRAVGIVGGLACVAVAAGVFVALGMPSWGDATDSTFPQFAAPSTEDRVAWALDGLSVAAIAACAAGACWMLATGRIDFGLARVAPRSEVDVPE